MQKLKSRSRALALAGAVVVAAIANVPAFAATPTKGAAPAKAAPSRAAAPTARAAALPPPVTWARRLQYDLTILGFFHGPQTGVYGPLTTAAVKKFQLAAHVVADGKWGPKSQAALKAMLKAKGK